MIGYSKKNVEIIRESAFNEKKKKPRLKFNPRSALTGVRTTGPRNWKQWLCKILGGKQGALMSM